MLVGSREGDSGPVEFEAALQWNEGYAETVLSFVNNISTGQGGTHVSGFSTSLTRVLNTYIKTHNLNKGDKNRLDRGRHERGSCCCCLSQGAKSSV